MVSFIFSQKRSGLSAVTTKLTQYLKQTSVPVTSHKFCRAQISSTGSRGSMYPWTAQPHDLGRTHVRRSATGPRPHGSAVLSQVNRQVLLLNRITCDQITCSLFCSSVIIDRLGTKGKSQAQRVNPNVLKQDPSTLGIRGVAVQWGQK